MKKQGYERYRKAALLPAAAGSYRQQGKELMEPVFQKIEAAIKKVADKKGLAVVVEKIP